MWRKIIAHQDEIVTGGLALIVLLASMISHFIVALSFGGHKL